MVAEFRALIVPQATNGCRRILGSKTRMRKGGQEGWMCDVYSDAIGV